MNLKVDGPHDAPMSSSDRPVSVILVGIGNDPEGISELIKDRMSLTVTDLDALVESLPLMLFERLERSEAEQLKFLFHLAGAEVELRVPREERSGISRPFGGTAAA